jgi:hypothetical protein
MNKAISLLGCNAVGLVGRYDTYVSEEETVSVFGDEDGDTRVVFYETSIDTFTAVRTSNLI